MAPMVAVAEPILVRVTCCDVLLPTEREPKLRVVADAVIVGAVPEPDAVMAVGEFVALLAIEIVVARLPMLWGANVIVAVAAAPGAIVEPVAMPLTE